MIFINASSDDHFAARSRNKKAASLRPGPKKSRIAAAWTNEKAASLRLFVCEPARVAEAYRKCQSTLTPNVSMSTSW
jgi:hypothetical protein